MLCTVKRVRYEQFCCLRSEEIDTIIPDNHLILRSTFKELLSLYKQTLNLPTYSYEENSLDNSVKSAQQN